MPAPIPPTSGPTDSSCGPGTAALPTSPARPWAGHPGQFLKVDSYTMQSAVGGIHRLRPASLMPIGTVAHETGHAFGLPDLYDTDLSTPKPPKVSENGG